MNKFNSVENRRNSQFSEKQIEPNDNEMTIDNKVDLHIAPNQKLRVKYCI